MIISASRRTDIPAFYGEWFIRRVEAGYCLVPNPFNPHSISRVSLRPSDVDAFVFWTKNPRPFILHLPRLDDLGFHYYFLYTVNDYPPPLEPRVPPLAERLKTFSALALRLGPERVIWRYDPIIFSREMDTGYHVERFSQIASHLHGLTSRVIVSFLDLYRKTERRLTQLESEIGDVFSRTPLQEGRLQSFLASLHREASSRDMEITCCAEEQVSSASGIEQGACVDAALLERLFHVELPHRKDPGQRPACRCVTSRDIGMSHSCQHGCTYCYATRSEAAAERNASRHSPKGETLFRLQQE